MLAHLDHISEEAEGITSFWFSVEHMPTYAAGQFIELYIPHSSKDKRGNKRWFTLSSSPDEPLLSISTKMAPDKPSSFKRALRSLEPKDPVFMSYPMGDFVLPADTTVPIVCIAGGIGVTPFRSMIKTLELRAENRDVTLLYTAKHSNELAFLDLFEHAHIRCVPLAQQASEDWKGEVGSLTVDRIMAEAQKGAHFYIAGPEPMVERITKDLQDNGVRRKYLHSDYFPGYGATV